jgi:hypothetical protein
MSARDGRRKLDAETEDFLVSGGWLVERGTAHRGVLGPDEYLDDARLFELVEAHLGFSLMDAQEVYRRKGGPLPEHLRGLRAALDDRLLELHDADQLSVEWAAAALGLTEQAIDRALARARGTGRP